ncbi:SAM-dependent methyltransferase [Corynebacterium halotolerans]|uniref:Methyltransferase n=1 Tax=Corynebacterium halotolerans YIM 70093 = DSM 44683 TaxID=1121362 RepID=M1P978_9CORY|nr:SAM-dependent methyltransferase [Corynebacterium halotolerans]AGF73236.1 methyltransferase [Corynebacterium halotolerans YIM 70093 = DSM 44683]
MNRNFFEVLYAGTEDPWELETSDYEARKYALTLAALPRHRYRSGFEPGCSVGVLTARLAERCEHLEAWEPIERPRLRCRERVSAAGLTERVTVTGEELDPDAAFPAADLIVLSEVLYYLPEKKLGPTLQRLFAAAQPGADIVAVHWRSRDEGMEMTGDEAHAELRDPRHGLQLLGGWREEEYVIDVFRLPERT